MSAKAETRDSATSTSSMDTVKLSVAVLIVLGATVAFYYYADQSLLLRVVGLLVAIVVAGVIAYQTEKGHVVAGFFKDAQIEIRKVVWPTRQETVQTTLIVLLVVIVVAVGLWLLDMFLGWAVQTLTAMGG